MQKYYVQVDDNNNVFAISQLSSLMVGVESYDDRLIGTTYDAATNTFIGYKTVLTTDKSTITANGTDTATITATVYNWDGTVATGYASDIVFDYDGSTKSVTPAAGVASITFATSVVGAHVVKTDNTDVTNGEVTINGQ